MLLSPQYTGFCSDINLTWKTFVWLLLHSQYPWIQLSVCLSFVRLLVGLAVPAHICPSIFYVRYTPSVILTGDLTIISFVCQTSNSIRLICFNPS